MKLAPWHVALGAGLLGAAVTLVVLVPRTVRRLEQRGQQLERQVASSSGAIGAQVRAMKTRLTAHAEATTLRAAENHLRANYGITEERMRNLDALARRLGVS